MSGTKVPRYVLRYVSGAASTQAPSGLSRALALEPGEPEHRQGIPRQSAQRQGLGVQLLRFVLRLALRMADNYGCVGVIVDAKPSAVGFYAKYGFVPVDAVEGRSDARPAPTPMFLSIRAITDALGP